MKELKSTTRKNYSLNKLVNHFERFQSSHFKVDPYRFSMNGSTVMIFEYETEDNAYYHIGHYDKQDLNELLESIYRTVRRQSEMKHYTREELATFHSIKLDNVYRQLFPSNEPEFITNNKLAQMSTEEIINEILKEYKRQYEQKQTQTTKRAN